MRNLLATGLLVVGINAHTDNSLANMLGMGGFDLWLNLE